jgi:hypothetical protein
MHIQQRAAPGAFLWRRELAAYPQGAARRSA